MACKKERGCEAPHTGCPIAKIPQYGREGRRTRLFNMAIAIVGDLQGVQKGFSPWDSDAKEKGDVSLETLIGVVYWKK